MQKALETAAKKLIDFPKNRKITVISHYDTDGITSASIISRALERLGRQFTVKIVKQLEVPFIESLPRDHLLIFTDLGSSSLPSIEKFPEVIIIDHHEIPTLVPSSISMINPHLFNEEELSGAGLTYLFAKQISPENKDLATLAVVGMVGDNHSQNLSKLHNEVIGDAEVTIKKGPLFYPATRPIHKTLEFSSSMFIPGVTGNIKGVLELLRDAGIERINGEYKSLLELDEEQTSHLITAILLRRHAQDNSDIIGNIFLVKLASRLEDARELSAMINACSRLGYPEIALMLCLGSKKARVKAEEVYANYKQHIVSALNFVSTMQKVEGKGYVIINAKNEIRDTMIGTIASIIANSRMHEPGTVIVSLAYSDEKIKVSTRICGREGRNARELLESVTSKIGGECGGHPLAAGCLIDKDKEQIFLDYLKKALDIELVKV